MVDYMTKIFNVFISHASTEEQQNLYENIVVHYADNKNIHIIDVNSRDKGINNNLCDDILSEINKCDLFICILTPIKMNDDPIKLNNNVILELGYSLDCIGKENIYIYLFKKMKN